MAADELRISEVFFSIQGESTWAGCPCVFVRLTGCHLRCAYCDTAYAFRPGQRRSVAEVLDEVCRHPCELVEITGGEPLLQPGVHGLIRLLCEAGKRVLIETSGACDISACDPRAIRIMDLKTPGSGEADRNRWANIPHLTERDEVKFVINDRSDLDWARQVIRHYRLVERCGAVLLSPVHEQAAVPEEGVAGCGGFDPRELAEWLLASGLQGVRMQLQMHKFIWDPQTRGV